MNKIIGLKELRTNLNRYANAVEKGESFIVMRRSKPLFRVSAVSKEAIWKVVEPTAAEKRAIIRGRKEFAEGKFVTWDQLKHDLASRS